MKAACSTGLLTGHTGADGSRGRCRCQLIAAASNSCLLDGYRKGVGKGTDVHRHSSRWLSHNDLRLSHLEHAPTSRAPDSSRYSACVRT